jgi:hypothetical protein
MVVMFYTRPTHSPGKSAENGRPFFEDKTFVRIAPPGERLNIVDREANESDKRRWPVQWAQFKENKEQIPDGTPIDMLYPDHPSIGAMLKASRVYTIEICAELSGNAIEEIGMGVQRYVNDAQKYLTMAEKGAKTSQFRRQMEELENKMRGLEHQIDLLKAENNKLMEVNRANMSLSDAQAITAGQQGRPQMPMPVRGMSKSFDAQTAQINATHPTALVPRKKATVATKQRARINA